ncbi:regulatory LuxR family protein [Crenobacter luteus]|uniref:helix-turn-helix domain-containing protein n=1 Tax=Crenobacter luteus TaxID=1452487 RepID=UPI0010E8B817|nr:helix-turn-helix transcriptional regulator [Crenobacter luteus]TCP13777.1 regulatory LuxR family protein [Crenobacter luteus]
MSSPSANTLHAIVEKVDAIDMQMVLERVADKSDVLAGVDIEVAASALIGMLRQAATAQLRADATLSVFTQREREVAALLVDGLTNLELAEQLGCTVRTVKAHIASMRDKTGTANRTALVAALKGAY